jgi:transposase-like protein
MSPRDIASTDQSGARQTPVGDRDHGGRHADSGTPGGDPAMNDSCQTLSIRSYHAVRQIHLRRTVHNRCPVTKHRGRHATRWNPMERRCSRAHQSSAQAIRHRHLTLRWKRAQPGWDQRQPKTAELILVKSSVDARRTPGFRLKRAMREVGIPERCARCGLGTTWNGEQLILHVDHVNGDFLDNRRENVRFLCPNCHSQTATFAGRRRRVLGRTLPAAPLAGTETPSRSETASSREDVVGVLVRFNDGELTAAQAAEELGCHRNHVFLMRKRLIEAGEMDPRIRERLRAAQRDAVIAFALENPDKGYRAISAALRERPNGRMIVGHDRIRAILLDVGLNTPGARRSAAVHARPDTRLDSSAQAEVAEWQTRRP